jgi:hypothetical protein
VELSGELREAATLIGTPTFDFPAEVPEPLPKATVRQRYTKCRTVASLNYSVFEAREIVMEYVPNDPAESKTIYRSEHLAELVPPRSRYAFDLIVHVGLESLLSCRRLCEVAQELAARTDALALSEKTLWRLQQKFLIYLGVLHQASFPCLAKYFREHGGYVLIIDSTCEDGPPALLVALEPTSGIVLGSWKLSSENKEETADVLQQIQQQLDDPLYILTDLSQALGEAAGKVFPAVPQKKCHFHFLSDVGEDLCDPPQKKLCKAMRSHKLQSSLKALRVDLRRRLLQGCRQRQEIPSLYACLHSDVPTDLNPRILQQQMLLSIHEWIADYASDGQREGYPFDPFFLYFHRRLQRARHVIEEILTEAARAEAKSSDFVALRNLRKRLDEYLSDSAVQQAACEFEEAYGYLQRVRQALRLPPDEESSTPRSEPYDLPEEQAENIVDRLDALVTELREELSGASRSQQRCIRIIVQHIEKYGDQLRPIQDQNEGLDIPRTTNAIEHFFRFLKRLRRRVHGRGNLRRDLLHLPPELPLIMNLTNAIYVEHTIGTLDALPKAFSRYTQQAQRLIKERKVDCGQHEIRLPKKTLRKPEFFDNLPPLTTHAVTNKVR